jgi:outer membrane protein TolC
MLRARGVKTPEDELTRELLSRQPDILAQWQIEAAEARAREPDRFPTMQVSSHSVRILNDVLIAHDLPLLGG